MAHGVKIARTKFGGLYATMGTIGINVIENTQEVKTLR